MVGSSPQRLHVTAAGQRHGPTEAANRQPTRPCSSAAQLSVSAMATAIDKPAADRKGRTTWQAHLGDGADDGTEANREKKSPNEHTFNMPTSAMGCMTRRKPPDTRNTCLPLALRAATSWGMPGEICRWWLGSTAAAAEHLELMEELRKGMEQPLGRTAGHRGVGSGNAKLSHQRHSNCACRSHCYCTSPARTCGGWPSRNRCMSSRDGCITPRRSASASWNSTVPPMALHAAFNLTIFSRKYGFGTTCMPASCLHSCCTPPHTKLLATFNRFNAVHMHPSHLAVRAATCSPTPRKAAISSIDSSAQLQVSRSEWQSVFSRCANSAAGQPQPCCG